SRNAFDLDLDTADKAREKVIDKRADASADEGDDRVDQRDEDHHEDAPEDAKATHRKSCVTTCARRTDQREENDKKAVWYRDQKADHQGHRRVHLGDRQDAKLLYPKLIHLLLRY